MDGAELTEAKRLLDVIAAAPRGSGSEGEARARKFCAEFLSAAGFRVTEEAFTYSSFAGRVATPAAGVVLLALFAGTTHVAASGNTPMAAIIYASCVLLLAAIGAMSGGAGVAGLPIMRRSATNLVALQESAGAPLHGDAPQLWLVAHLDSKSQPVSILARGAAVTLCIILATATGTLLALQHWFSELPRALWLAVSVLGSLAAIPILLSIVRDESHGALDNGTGVVALLLAAARLSAEGVRGVGVLLTSAEELGLAGAHVWSRGREPAMALNIDTADDSGVFLCLCGRRRDGLVLGAVRAAALGSETRLVERRMLSGILVDSMAFEARGWDSATICRGTLRSLNRVHTRQDVAENCSGEGAVHTAGIVRRSCEILLNGGR